MLEIKISQLDFFFPDLFSTTSQTFPEVSDLCARDLCTEKCTQIHEA